LEIWHGLLYEVVTTTYQTRIATRSSRSYKTMPNHQQLVEIASTISTAAEKLNDFYDEEALELRFPGGKPTNEQGQTISQALEAVLQLQRMLLGPLGSIMSLSVSRTGSQLMFTCQLFLTLLSASFTLTSLGRPI
jgi:hypothetical protein